MTDRDLAVRAIIGYIADTVDLGNPPVSIQNPRAVALQLVKRRQARFTFTDGGTAGTNATEATAFVPNVPVTIIGIRISSPVAVAANNANYKTLLVSRRTAGGAPTTVATNTTQVTDPQFGASPAAFVNTLMTLSATPANLVLAANDALTLSAIATGAGVALASATAPVLCEVVYEEN